MMTNTSFAQTLSGRPLWYGVVPSMLIIGAIVTVGVSSLSGNAHQTLQSVQEFGRASEDLQSAIGILRQAVGEFKE